MRGGEVPLLGKQMQSSLLNTQQQQKRWRWGTEREKVHCKMICDVNKCKGAAKQANIFGLGSTAAEDEGEGGEGGHWQDEGESDRMKARVDRMKVRGDRWQTDKLSFPSLGPRLLLLIQQQGKTQIITLFHSPRNLFPKVADNVEVFCVV